MGLMGENNPPLPSPPPQKPYLIYSKTPYRISDFDSMCSYKYTDPAGRRYEFIDDCDKYIIGDMMQ